MKNGFASLVIILLFGASSALLFYLLDNSAQLLESAYIRQEEIRNTYAAEGLARIGLSLFKSKSLAKDVTLAYMGGTITSYQKNKYFFIAGKFKGKKVAAKLKLPNYEVVAWVF